MEKNQVDLIILSPTPEVNKLTFPGIPTATTIGELRERISATAPSHPAPGRQRLIYRGHALIDARKTLKDVFTQDIIDSSETLSLHLVLPPEAAVQPSTSSTPSNIPLQGPRSRTPQHAHRNPDIGGNPQTTRQGIAPQATTPASVGQLNTTPLPHQVPPSVPPQPQPQHGHAHIHGHVHGGLPPGQFPPQLQQAFAQFHAVNQQLATQLAAIGNNPMLQGMHTNQAQAPHVQQPAFAPPALQHLLAQQQQQATAAGSQQGLPGALQHDVQANNIPSTANSGAPPASGGAQGINTSPVPGNTNTVVRENVGPNGERWQMVIQSGPIHFNPNNVFPNQQAALAHATAGNTRHPSPSPYGNNQAQPAATDGVGRAQTLNIALVHLQSNLSTIEASMAGGSPPPDSVFDQAREMLRSIPGLPPDTQTSLRTRIDGLASQARQSRDHLHHQLVRDAHERVAAQRLTQGVESSAVYVLSSPSGPHALLVSPSGLYTTPWQFPTIGAIAPPSSINSNPAYSTLERPPLHQRMVMRQQQRDNAAQVAEAQQQAPPVDAAQAVQAQQQQQQQEANQARDLARILLPLGGHLWLMIRLFGFVYFFTAGAGWRRTILLGLAAIIVFIAQTGFFRPVVQGLWDPIRRHAEGLVPLIGNERPGPAAAGIGNNANAAGTQPANREPTPQEAAERLLQERERQNGNFLRQSMRRIERAIALFVASLVPGVGERHIAAREAAEAARQAEIRAREEQARREEAEARERQAESVQEEDGADGSDAAAAGLPEGSSRTHQEQTAQAPLAEV